MSSLDPQTLSWLRTHHSTISSDALEQRGIGVDRRKQLVEAGVLRRVVDGGYTFTGAELSELARCAAICTSRPHLVVAGPTAGRIWGLRRVPRDGLVHVLAPPASHPCQERWVRAYRTPLIFADETVTRPDGIRLSSPPRTVVDLSRYVEDQALASVVEDAIHRSLTSVATLQRTALRLATPGRPWARRFLEVLDRRHPDAAAESEGELRVFDALRARGVAGLQRQVRVVLPGYGPARFDVAIPELRWALEVDLHPVHASPEGVANDNARDDCSSLAGWETRRLGELQYRTQFDATIDRLVASIERRRADVDALRASGRWPLR